MKENLRQLYLRLLPASSPENGTQKEAEQLQNAIREAPGVLQVNEVKSHNKGGYSVVLEIEANSIEEVLERCQLLGYQPVL